MTRKQRRLVLIGSGLAVLALAAALVLSALKDSIVFFNSPTDIVEKQIKPGTRIRLGGLVQPGSVIRRDLDARFEVTDGKNTIAVNYRGILPDLFREGQGVVTEGTLTSGGFVADTVLAKQDCFLSVVAPEDGEYTILVRETSYRGAENCRYRLHVGSADDVHGPAARVAATRIGKTEKGTRFLVDFVGPELARGEEVQAVVTTTGGRILEQHVEQNSFAEGVRASFEVAPEPNTRDVELRAFLKSTNDVLTETWSYLWQPN